MSWYATSFWVNLWSFRRRKRSSLSKNIRKENVRLDE
jgi:hypothetical protein